MNADEINAAIAETQGWRIKSIGGCNYLVPPDTGVWKGSFDHFHDRIVGLKKVHSLKEFFTRYAHAVTPNYHGSLDAIVPVVRAMPDLKRAKVIIELVSICLGQVICLATPAQWCEAYLRSEGLWK